MEGELPEILFGHQRDTVHRSDESLLESFKQSMSNLPTIENVHFVNENYESDDRMKALQLRLRRLYRVQQTPAPAPAPAPAAAGPAAASTAAAPAPAPGAAATAAAAASSITKDTVRDIVREELESITIAGGSRGPVGPIGPAGPAGPAGPPGGIVGPSPLSAIISAARGGISSITKPSSSSKYTITNRGMSFTVNVLQTTLGEYQGKISKMFSKPPSMTIFKPNTDKSEKKSIESDEKDKEITVVSLEPIGEAVDYYNFIKDNKVTLYNTAGKQMIVEMTNGTRVPIKQTDKNLKEYHKKLEDAFPEYFIEFDINSYNTLIGFIRILSTELLLKAIQAVIARKLMKSDITVESIGSPASEFYFVLPGCIIDSVGSPSNAELKLFESISPGGLIIETARNVNLIQITPDEAVKDSEVVKIDDADMSIKSVDTIDTYEDPLQRFTSSYIQILSSPERGGGSISLPWYIFSSRTSSIPIFQFGTVGKRIIREIENLTKILDDKLFYTKSDKSPETIPDSIFFADRFKTINIIEDLDLDKPIEFFQRTPPGYKSGGFKTYYDEEIHIFNLMKTISRSLINLFSSAKDPATIDMKEEYSIIKNIDTTKYFNFSKPRTTPQLRIVVSEKTEPVLEHESYRQKVYEYLKKYLEIQIDKFTFYQNIATLGLNYLATTPKLGITSESRDLMKTIFNMIKQSSLKIVNEMSEMYAIVVRSDFNYKDFDSFSDIISTKPDTNLLPNLIKLEPSNELKIIPPNERLSILTGIPPNPSNPRQTTPEEAAKKLRLATETGMKVLERHIQRDIPAPAAAAAAAAAPAAAAPVAAAPAPAASAAAAAAPVAAAADSQLRDDF
jgi:hypothetical protein